MAKHPVSRKKAFVANPDPIFVVPLHQPKPAVSLRDLPKSTGAPESLILEIATAPQKPVLVYFGGPLIANVQVCTIFWGENWDSVPALQTIMTDINDFFNKILVSPLFDQMAEYSVPAFSIGRGRLIHNTVVTKGAPSVSTSDTSLKTALKSWIHAGIVPKSSDETLYFIYLEPNIQVKMGGSKSCTSFCGYHNYYSTTSKKVYYAVMPFPSCQGCLGGLGTFEALCATSSHELCEAITDPIPGTGWYDQHNGEIGDICSWQFKQLSGYTVQMEWSNKLDKCL